MGRLSILHFALQGASLLACWGESHFRVDNVSPPADRTISLAWATLGAGLTHAGQAGAIQLVPGTVPSPAPPVIIRDPRPTVTPTNCDVTLSVTATGQDLTYQWRKNGKDLSDGGKISGATTSALTIHSFGKDDESNYNVAVSNPGGSATSRNASVRLSKYDINDGLVGHWKFDEASGATAANSVAGGEAGTANGAVGWAAGQIANALSFDGLSTYVFVPDYPVAERQLSLTAWVKVAADLSGDVALVRNAVGSLGLSPAGQFELGLIYDPVSNSLKPSAAIGADTNIARATGVKDLPLGSWQHVAFSADGAQLRLYVNGLEVASADYDGALNPPAISWLSIGAQLAEDPDTLEVGPDPNSPNFMSGQMDDIGLWTRGLTANEIRQVFNAGKSAKDLGTVIETTPPCSGPEVTLEIRFSQGRVTISWTPSVGTLQEASSLNEPIPWSDVVGADNPFTTQATGSGKYYQIRQ